MLKDIRQLPTVQNFDPCTKRFTMTADALKATGGPFVGRDEVEKLAIGIAKPTKVRSYFLPFGQYQKIMNDTNVISTIYPEREVWLVVVQAPDQGPVPSVPQGIQPWPRRYYYEVYDATTMKLLVQGGNGPNEGDWPASLPLD
jgi:hypothetical protein